MPPPTDDQAAIAELGLRWARAELAGDITALEALLGEGFEAVGPLGYVLGRAGWLDRHRSGGVTYERFDWNHPTARIQGDAAIVVGVQTARARQQAEVMAGSYRTTLVALRSGGRWWIEALALTAMNAGADAPET